MNKRTFTGFLLALGAYGTWGFFPLYWKMLQALPPSEVACHRIFWSFIFLTPPVLFWWRKQVWKVLSSAELGLILISSFLIGINWFVYLIAVDQERILEASLGYYINPILNVLLGVFFLKERLRRLQWGAVFLVAASVVWMTLRCGVFPWIALTLALAFGLYGYVRKKIMANSIAALWIETCVLSFAVLIYHTYRWGFADRGHTSETWFLLIGGGVVTALPLLFFGGAAKRLKLSSLGLIQYLTPTTQFLIAILIFGEKFDTGHAVSFVLIWAALLGYLWDGYLRNDYKVQAKLEEGEAH